VTPGAAVRIPGRRIALAPVFAIAMTLGLRADADPLPRIAHLTEALAAVRALGPAGRAQLDRAIYAMARAQCHADTATPAATWVDEATRFRLVRGSTDYHAALAAELHRRYAALAAELVVGAEPGPLDPRSADRGGAPGGAGDAAAIDQLCAHRDRAIHACQPGDIACVPSLPWSRCVAALIWFVGGAG